MREPAPDFTSGPYERVNQPWVCGLASEGATCPAGPTARGECPALAECAPVREGDRWQCNRSALRGGVCVEGPSPAGECGRVHCCRPVRSLRAVRGRFVAACAVLTAGALLIVLSSGSRNRVIAPGPLAMPHAQLLAQADGDANCAACHAAAQKSVSGWTAALVAGHGDGPTQSELCGNCHGKSISVETALMPHNVPADRLREITEARTIAAVGSLNHTAKTNFSPDSKIACSTCHREHQGAHADLSAMDNAACQACHQRRYESFANDHPDFGAWPYERRTRIAFNHASHRSKHFADEHQAFDCRMCHVEDATQAVQLTGGYEAACAACHDEKIATSVAQGVPMLALPMLDVEALRAARHDIGPWPDGASVDFDGRLSPMMKLLLAADPAAAKAIGTLGEDFEFLDIDRDDEAQLAAAADLAAAIKRMLADMSERGPAAVRERLSAALGRDVAQAEVAALMAGLSLETIRGAAGWVTSADGAATDWGRGSSWLGLAELDPPYFGPPFGPAGAWFRDDATFTVRYRPAAHADPVLTGWLELLAKTPNLAQQPLALAMFEELSSPTSTGLCASCHSVEQHVSGELVVNWRASTRESKPRTFTKFTHGPHVILPQLADCTRCHALNESATATAYVAWAPHRFASDFLPMSKRQCIQCHTRAAAGDRCQSCHNYHVGDRWRSSQL